MPALPTILDIEASGFGRGSYPIEVGVALPDQTTFCRIIRPAESWTHWDEDAEALHGLDRNTLLESGKPVPLVAQQFNQLLAGQLVYSDAWGHDMSWLGKLYDEAELPQLFRLETLRKLLTEEQAALWHQVKDQVIHERRLERHRASTDAAILQMTFARTQAMIQP